MRRVQLRFFKCKIAILLSNLFALEYARRELEAFPRKISQRISPPPPDRFNDYLINKAVIIMNRKLEI